MTTREELIAKIVELELDMFLAVPADGIYSCQQDPHGFGLHRRVQFSIWSQDTLQSYLDDLYRAKKDGINLMTIKYARMQGLIARENRNPLIADILTIQYRWQEEMVQKYPYFMAGARHLPGSEDTAEETAFETYLSGELETYSDDTLALLHRDVIQLQKRGINGSEQIYGQLVKALGYDSIEAANQAQKRSLKYR